MCSVSRIPYSRLAPGPAWGAWLTEATDDMAAMLRANTYTGWPTGSDAFMGQLAIQRGRRLSRQPTGRKKRQDENT